MRPRDVAAAALLGLVAVGCGGGTEQRQATPTTTATTMTLGEDPTKPTTTSAAAVLLAKVTGSLRAHGFQVTRVRKVDPEGGRLSG